MEEVVSIKCRLCIHTWGKWGYPLDGLSYTMQFRECLVCGKLGNKLRHHFNDILGDEIVASLPSQNESEKT